MAKRQETSKKGLEEIRQRVERRKYNAMVDQIEGFSNRKKYERQKEKDDFKFVMAFGFGFISLTLMGFVTGFVLGKFVLNWNEE